MAGGGHGETGNSLLPDIVRVPERVPGLHAMALVAAGDMFSGAVGMDGQVWMWGKCGRGRLVYPPATPQTFKATEPRSLGLGAFGGQIFSQKNMNIQLKIYIYIYLHI